MFIDLQEKFVDNDGDGGQDIITGIEVVTGTSGNDTIIGGNPFNDDFEDFRPGAGNDTVDGDTGFDRVRYQTASSGVTVNLSNASITSLVTAGVVAAGTADDGDGGTDTLISIESIVGSSNGDHLVGNSGSFTQFRPREVAMMLSTGDRPRMKSITRSTISVAA